jgi:hypothetical protein
LNRFANTLQDLKLQAFMTKCIQTFFKIAFVYKMFLVCFLAQSLIRRKLLGRAAGGLYAGASAGGGVGAGAGLGGISGASGSVGGSYAGASSGSVETHVTKIAHKAPAVASGHISAEVAAPVVHHKEVEIIAEQPKSQTTYIERTVIPNYVEKKIQVPSYVEKTIRVPTTVEKTIRVPAEPTVIEKTVEAPASAAVNVRGSFSGEVAAPETITYVQKTKVHGHHRPHVHSRIHYKNM